MNKQVFFDAIGQRQPGLQTLLDVADYLENVNGKIVMIVRPMRYEFIRCAARGITAWDNKENTETLCTYDLDSFRCNDLGALIQKIRIA